MRPKRKRVIVAVRNVEALLRRLRRAVIDGRAARKAEPLRPQSLRRQARSTPWLRVLPGPVLRRVSAVADAFEAHDLALDAAAEATGRPDAVAEDWTALGAALSHAGPSGPRRVSILGITRQRLPEHGAALDARRRAHTLAGGADTATKLAEALLSSGEVDEPIELMRRTTTQHPLFGEAWSVLAHALAERVRRNGVMTSSDVAEISRSLRAARDGGHQAATFHLVRHASRFRDWKTAFDAAGGDQHSTWTESSEALERMIADRDVTRSPDWWYVLSWKLRAAGRPDLGHAARRREAVERCRQPIPAIPTVNDAWQRTRAHIVLDDLDAASETISSARRVPDPSGRLERLAADLELRRGRPGHLVAWRRRHDTGLPVEAEDLFQRLISSKDVVIVGPNATTAQRERAGERFDVLVDTKRLDARASSECPVISYYADTSFALFERRIRTLVDSGAMALAVVRPTFLNSSDQIGGCAQIRIMPSEDSLCTDGSHFGIARAVYDVLQAEPRTITLVGVDMFTAESAYPASYVTDRPTYSEREIAHAVPAFSHDLADDHTMLSRLLEQGVVSADDETAAILRLPLAEYLTRVSGRDLT